MNNMMENNTGDSNLHLTILQDVSQIINYSENFQETLNKVVSLVSQKLNMDVCSIYMLDNLSNTLVLQATKGLSVKSLGLVRLKRGEGVTSLAIEQMRPIAIESVQDHPRFLYFPESEESQYLSFLGVPIIDSKNPIGVLVVQKKEKYHFHNNEINMLQVLAAQVSSVIQVSRVLDKTIKLRKEGDGDEEDVEEAKEKKVLTFQGIPTSFGYGYGRVLILDERYVYPIVTDKKVDDHETEITRFNEAIAKSKEEVKNIKKGLQQQISEDILKIFDSHIMILDDQQLNKKVIDFIKQGYNAAYATVQVIDQYIETFSSIEDPYIREKIVDIEDIGRRLVNNLLGIQHVDIHHLPEPSIVVAKFLTPSTTAKLDTSKIMGIVTEKGGVTSHASILARSLEIPAVVGVKNLFRKVGMDDYLVVDGNTGFVFLNPPKALVHEYEKKAESEIHEYHDYFLQNLSHPLKTEDDIAINISANIGMLMDIEIAKKNGAKSVGLLRTEFLYMTRNQLPGVQEQYELYKEVVESFPEGEIIVRTLDIGGDKVLSYLPLPEEENPVLGYRSTRFMLDHPKVLTDQLRATLRASCHGNLKILFPMISSLGELIQLKDFLEISKGTLLYNGIDFNEHIKIGMMIEVPSVIFQIEDYIPEVDFFSIGTNDLIQYLLAVDRDNEKVSNVYNPLHPSVLRALDILSKKIMSKNKKLAVCGEMAGNPHTALALLALGIRDLSANPSSIPYIHYLVRRLNQNILDEIAHNILSFNHVRDIEIYLRKKIIEIAPKLPR